MKKITQASPGIWKKFTKQEKRLWHSIFKEVRNKFVFPPGWDGRDPATRGMRDVVAHNVAILMVWREQSRK